MKMPLNIGLVHFIGIGGIGMSGIAEVLHNLGYKVQGSDQSDSASVQRLRERALRVLSACEAENLGECRGDRRFDSDQEEQSELVAAREKLLPVCAPRRKCWPRLMRFRQLCGRHRRHHGKTTTTSQLAALLDAGHLDPAVMWRHHQRLWRNARMGDGRTG
ncbi:Mur ligase domain-containing protein [Brucella abortus]|nr:Mur ligase domain-containing protein [Brucella abortus]